MELEVGKVGFRIREEPILAWEGCTLYARQSLVDVDDVIVLRDILRIVVFDARQEISIPLSSDGIYYLYAPQYSHACTIMLVRYSNRIQ
jgi:hypothetical protein